MNLDFNTLFNGFKPTSQTINDLRYQDGYVKNSFDILLNKTYRINAVKKSKLMDYNYLEADKNFSKRKSQENLEKILGQMSASTQLVNVVKTQFTVLQIFEYLPQNMQDILLNYQSFMDTNINFLSLFKQDLSFQKMAGALASDLIGQYASGNLYLNQILQISTKITDLFVYTDSISNNSIRQLLSLNILNLLPFDTTEIFNTLQYASLLELLFSDDSMKDSFQNALDNFYDSFNDRNVGSVVSGTYNNLNLSFDDPFGFVAQTQFNNDLVSSFSEELEQFLDDNVDGDYTDLHEYLLQDFQANVDEALISQGLPSVSSTIKAVENEVYNKTGIYMVNAIEDVVKYIINDLGVLNIPSGQKSIDFLFNLKRNIAARKNIYSQNDAPSDITDNDNYFKFILGDNFTVEDFNILSEKFSRLEENNG